MVDSKNNPQQASHQSIQLFFNGEKLIVSMGSEELYHAKIIGSSGLKNKIQEGRYSVYANELLANQWLNPSMDGRLTMANLWGRNAPSYYEQLCITLHSSDESSPNKKQSFFLFVKQPENYRNLNSPSIFFDFLGQLQWMAVKLKQTEIPFTITHKEPHKKSSENVGKAGRLNIDKLKGVIPLNVIIQIPQVAREFGITSNLRLAHFLAQCGHESGGFTKTTENLNYSEKGLEKTFKKYFRDKDKKIDKEKIKLYAHEPEKIGSLVYASRNGNGDESSGEGYRYRGRGYIQLTGKTNYEAFSKFIGDSKIMENPNLVSVKYPLASAGFYFYNRKGLWSICDKGATVAVVTAVTKKVNGGTNGLADRIKRFKVYYALLEGKNQSKDSKKTT